MKINASPRATCNNYLINDFTIQDDLIPKEIHDYKDQIIDKNIISYSNQLLKMPFNYTAKYDLKDNDTLNLDFSFDEKSDHLVENIEINVQNCAKSSIFVNFSSLKKFFHNGQIRLNLADKSEVSFCVTCDLNSPSGLDLQIIKCVLNSGCKLEVCFIEFATSCISARNLNVEMIGDDSTLFIKTISLANASEVDYNLLVNVFGQRSEMDMQSVSVLKESDKHFKGTIDFKTGSNGSRGREAELCLPLDNESKSLSLPMILCAEEDVDISHATSTGKMDDKALFYLNSRGIDDKEASKIYILSQLSALTKDLPEKLTQKISSEIERIVYEK